MNSKTKKMIGLSLLLLILSGGAIGYYLFSKGPVDVKNSSGKKTDAKSLYTSFSTDTITAQKKFSGKILEVGGVVNEVLKNRENSQVVTLKTSIEGAFINCTMEEENPDIKPGENIVIKGICSGIGQGEPELGIKGDVYLSRCFSVK